MIFENQQFALAESSFAPRKFDTAKQGKGRCVIASIITNGKEGFAIVDGKSSPHSLSPPLDVLRTRCAECERLASVAGRAVRSWMLTHLQIKEESHACLDP